MSDEQKPNKFQGWIDAANAIDAWRIFPRAFISVYIYLLWAVITWFMTLDAPTMEQAGLISIMTGVGAAWFSQYCSTGNKSDK